MKVIGLIKKEWLTLLDKLDELSGVDSHVLAFAKKVQENLKTLDEAEYYVAFYVGETIQLFQGRMSRNYPTAFLTPFPATHVFKFCQVKDGTCKDLVSTLRTRWRPSWPYGWKASSEMSLIFQVTFSMTIHVGIDLFSDHLVKRILPAYHMRHSRMVRTNHWWCTTHGIMCMIHTDMKVIITMYKESQSRTIPSSCIQDWRVWCYVDLQLILTPM